LEEKYGADRMYRDGLRVYTGLDPALQRAAEDSMEAYLRRIETARGYKQTRKRYEQALEKGESLGPPGYLQGAVVAIDVKTGLVRAMVGGRSFKDSKFNRAVQARRQPGSSFKPFIFCAALENGYTPADILLDAPIVLDLPNGDVWKPENYSRTFEGEVTVRHAINTSINIAAIRLLMAMGPGEAINVAHRLGVKSDLEAVYSLALGVSEVTLLELTNAYATIAAGGMRGEPILLSRLVDREGRVLEENTILREDGMTGGAVSLPTWTAVMKTAYRGGHHASQFPVPEGIESRVVCELTGLLATESCPKIRREVFIEGTEPQRSCDRHGSASARPIQDIQTLEEIDRALIDGD
jgi:penicillin-binding protein 1A